MKWIPKYQKTGKLNFKTSGLPWQQSKQDQEITRNAQSTGTLNPTNLKRRLQPAAKNLKAKYNNLSVRERMALAKQSMPHSEVVTVRDQLGNTKTDTNPQAGAMSGADLVGEFVVGTATGNLGLGLGKMALSKMGQNAVSHWARNSLLNETAGNLTKNIATPLMESEAVPLEDGFVYRTFIPSHGGWVRDGRVYNRNYGIGDVKVQNGKYYSVRQAHFNNPDKLWWDKFGHNRGRVVQVTKESNTQSLQDAANNGFSLNWGSFGKGYRLSDPIKTNEVINYKLDPLTNTMVPSMPGKIINNKQTPSEILSTPIANNYYYLNNTYTGFKGIKPKLQPRELNNQVQNVQLPSTQTIRLYRGQGRNLKFNPQNSANGEAGRQYAGQWFTPNKNKPSEYMFNALRGKNRASSVELQYVDIPIQDLEKYKASNILKGSNLEYEPEDFLIPLNIHRTSVTLDNPERFYTNFSRQVQDLINKQTILK